MPKFTNKGLIRFARQMCDYNAPYWYGCFGQYPADEDLFLQKRRQYKENYDKWSKASFESQYGMKVADCAGLIKAYLFSPCIDADGYVTNFLTDVVYNSKYDWSANMMIKHCSETGDISTIPEIEGLIVWKDGHVGIYDGNGFVIEERGHSYGTVRSRLADRPFTMWGKLDVIEYLSEPAPTPTPAPEPSGYDLVNEQMPILHKGDKCDEVSLLQLLLNSLGFRDGSGSKLEVDGHYGNHTFEAVCDMQEAWNLGADGTVGYKTWEALLHHRYKGI